MCELNLVTLQCATVKLSILLVRFFACRSLQTVPSDSTLQRSEISVLL